MEYIFPKDFLWGRLLLFAQIEGATQKRMEKGLSIWDVFSRIPGKVTNSDTQRSLATTMNYIKKTYR